MTKLNGRIEERAGVVNPGNLRKLDPVEGDFAERNLREE